MKLWPRWKTVALEVLECEQTTDNSVTENGDPWEPPGEPDFSRAGSAEWTRWQPEAAGAAALSGGAGLYTYGGISPDVEVLPDTGGPAAADNALLAGWAFAPEINTNPAGMRARADGLKITLTPRVSHYSGLAWSGPAGVETDFLDLGTTTVDTVITRSPPAPLVIPLGELTAETRLFEGVYEREDTYAGDLSGVHRVRISLRLALTFGA